MSYTDDGTGTPITSTGSALDVNIKSGTVTINGTVTANQGTPNTPTNSWPVEVTDGTNILGTSAHPVRTDPTGTTTQPVSGTVSVNALPTGSNTIGKVDVLGNAGAIIDAVITAATAPANALAILSVNNTTAPSLTTGQSVALQSDYEGSVFVKPYRRAQTVSKATSISATTATTVLAAQAAGIFADISTLIITATPIVTSVATTATLSDGTASYIFDFIPGTATSAGTGELNYTFNPPLPATAAATAWTLTMSTANTVHVTVVAVLQKAS